MKKITNHFNKNSVVFTSFVNNYERKDGNILIHYSDGDKTIPYSLEAEKELLKRMKEQALEMVKIDEIYEIDHEKWTKILPYNIITNVICYESIKKTTPGSKIHNLMYSLLVLSSVSTLYQCINSIKEINNIKELKKYRLFLEHEDLINELNKTGINLTINDLDNYSYNSLSEIINRFGQNKEYTKKKI